MMFGVDLYDTERDGLFPTDKHQSAHMGLRRVMSFRAFRDSSVVFDAEQRGDRVVISFRFKMSYRVSQKVLRQSYHGPHQLPRGCAESATSPSMSSAR